MTGPRVDEDRAFLNWPTIDIKATVVVFIPSVHCALPSEEGRHPRAPTHRLARTRSRRTGSSPGAPRSMEDGCRAASSGSSGFGGGDRIQATMVFEKLT
ncbi:hypothetical protein ACFVAE_09340 [Microbacterium sp. NPDC057659]|uniref:hypothetical protein n=1 Tax=Microbacterium sp. NPDC057659 TaxID=3346198 RepID=UPI00366F4FFD